jgi:hypothetical protein
VPKDKVAREVFTDEERRELWQVHKILLDEGKKDQASVLANRLFASLPPMNMVAS